jgi:hypothetical protein
MHHKHFRMAATLAAMALLAACSDPRLDKLALGISKDSVAKLIGDTPHRTNVYLTSGKQWEVEFYARSSAAAKDSIAWRKMSPVIYIGGKTIGWGWGWWSGTSKKQGIEMPK